MFAAARHDCLVIADSDVHAPPDYLSSVVAELARPGTGLVTTLSVGLPATKRLPERLAATQITYGFLPGVLMARALGRQDCLGITMGAPARHAGPGGRARGPGRPPGRRQRAGRVGAGAGAIGEFGHDAAGHDCGGKDADGRVRTRAALGTDDPHSGRRRVCRLRPAIPNGMGLPCSRPFGGRARHGGGSGARMGDPWPGRLANRPLAPPADARVGLCPGAAIAVSTVPPARSYVGRRHGSELSNPAGDVARARHGCQPRSAPRSVDRPGAATGLRYSAGGPDCGWRDERCDLGNRPGHNLHPGHRVQRRGPPARHRPPRPRAALPQAGLGGA